MANHNSKRSIAESSTTPHDFIAKYEDLKLKNIRDVDAVTYIAAEVIKVKILLYIYYYIFLYASFISYYYLYNMIANINCFYLGLFAILYRDRNS